MGVYKETQTMTTFASKFILPLNKTVETGKLDKKGKKEKERVQVGSAVVPYPSLADFGIVAVQAKDEKGQDMFGTDGVPVYADDKFDWLQTAIVDKVSAKVRNYYVSGVNAVKVDYSTVKDGKLPTLLDMVVDSGKRLPTDFDILTEEGKRSGEALAIRREARNDFEAYLGSINKSQAVIQALGELFFNSSRVLGSASQKYVEALGQHTQAWTEKLDEAKTARFAPKIVELQESINAALESSELDLS